MNRQEKTVMQAITAPSFRIVVEIEKCVSAPFVGARFGQDLDASKAEAIKLG